MSQSNMTMEKCPCCCWMTMMFPCFFCPFISRRLSKIGPARARLAQLSGLGTPSKGISSAMAGQNEKL